jgi:hypothetical protein
MNKNISNLIADGRKNVLHQAYENVPIPEVGHSKRKYTTKGEIQYLAREKSKSSGYGITVEDVIRRFSVKKKQAQLCLKNFRRKGVLFTARHLIDQGIDLISSTKPQQYFSMQDKPCILENLKGKKNIPVEPTGVNLSTANHLSQLNSLLSNAVKSQTEKAQSFLDVLQFLPFTPPCIHKLQLLLHINKEYYKELQQTENPVNKAKCHEEIIGRRYVTYTYSPDGVVEVAIRSNATPFSIATDEDVSIIFSFLGQVKDRILFHLSDPRERAVPTIMDWTLKACDLNKDILTSDKAQLTLPDIQLRLAGRVFRSYVKIMEGKASYRLEESLRLNQILPEALDNIRHPYRSLENKIIRVAEQLSQLNNSVNMILIAMDNRVSFEKPTIANGFENSRWV